MRRNLGACVYLVSTRDDATEQRMMMVCIPSYLIIGSELSLKGALRKAYLTYFGVCEKYVIPNELGFAFHKNVCFSAKDNNILPSSGCDTIPNY